MTWCRICHQPIRARLSRGRSYCSDHCKYIAGRRKAERDSFGQFLAQQRMRIRGHLRDEVAAYKRRQAEARERSLSSGYSVEQRGWTYGGTPSRTRFQEQED